MGKAPDLPDATFSILGVRKDGSRSIVQRGLDKEHASEWFIQRAESPEFDVFFIEREASQLKAAD